MLLLKNKLEGDKYVIKGEEFGIIKENDCLLT